MKKVERYKCDYCKKTAAKPDTIERHEKECIKNPNSRNCYLCVHSVQGGYVDMLPYGEESFESDIPFCNLHQEPLSTLRQFGRTALKCEDFKRDNCMYWDKQAER